jgi:hypothetical protein
VSSNKLKNKTNNILWIPISARWFLSLTANKELKKTISISAKYLKQDDTLFEINFVNPKCMWFFHGHPRWFTLTQTSFFLPWVGECCESLFNSMPSHPLLASCVLERTSGRWNQCHVNKWIHVPYSYIVVFVVNVWEKLVFLFGLFVLQWSCCYSFKAMSTWR